MNEPIRTQWQIRCAFNGFCKLALKREAMNAHRDTKQRQLREVTFSDLSPLEENQLYVCDQYFADDEAEQSFVVGGKEITAKNKRDSNGVLTGRPGTVYDVNIKYTAPDGKKKSYAKKGFATKKEATQHEAEMKTKLQNPGQIASISRAEKSKERGEEKEQRFRALTALSLYCFL